MVKSGLNLKTNTDVWNIRQVMAPWIDCRPSPRLQLSLAYQRTLRSQITLPRKNCRKMARRVYHRVRSFRKSFSVQGLSLAQRTLLTVTTRSSAWGKFQAAQISLLPQAKTIPAKDKTSDVWSMKHFHFYFKIRSMAWCGRRGLGAPIRCGRCRSVLGEHLEVNVDWGAHLRSKNCPRRRLSTFESVWVVFCWWLGCLFRKSTAHRHVNCQLNTTKTLSRERTSQEWDCEVFNFFQSSNPRVF